MTHRNRALLITALALAAALVLPWLGWTYLRVSDAERSIQMKTAPHTGVFS